MNWFIIALMPGFFWAMSNIVDQFMARSYFDQKIAPFLVLSGFCTLPVALALLIWHPDVLQLPLSTAFILFGIGGVQVLAVVPYLKALQAEDSSVAIPFFQAIPFLVFLLGWLFLGEKMPGSALLGGMIIMLGAIAISWKPRTSSSKGGLNMRVVAMMLIASFLYAVSVVVTREMVQQVPWYACTFWVFVFWLVASIIASVYMPGVLSTIRAETKSSKGRVIFFCMMQEWLDCAAQLMLALALSLAPTAAHVSFMGGIGPLYVIVMAGTAGLFLPKIYTPLKADKSLVFKIVCCLVTLAGLALLTYGGDGVKP
jgi:drug/metabolite transporter (DMT)-like permease